MTDDDKRKLREAQQDLANAERAIDAAKIKIRAALNGPAGRAKARRGSGQPPPDED